MPRLPAASLPLVSSAPCDGRKASDVGVSWRISPPGPRPAPHSRPHSEALDASEQGPPGAVLHFSALSRCAAAGAETQESLVHESHVLVNLTLSLLALRTGRPVCEMWPPPPRPREAAV